MVVDVIKALANNSADENFNKAIENANERQKDGNVDYLSLFEEEYEKLSSENGLSIIYYAQLKNKGIRIIANGIKI